MLIPDANQGRNNINPQIPPPIEDFDDFEDLNNINNGDDIQLIDQNNR